MQDDGQRLSEVSYGKVRNETFALAPRLFGWPCTDLVPDSNLMAPDEFKNLGFAEEQRIEPIPNHEGGATAQEVRDDGKKIS